MLSPNVLLRPAVQDSIFPTVCICSRSRRGSLLRPGCSRVRNAADADSAGRSPHQCDGREARSSRRFENTIWISPMCFRGRDFLKRKAVDEPSGCGTVRRVRDRMIAELESLRSAVEPSIRHWRAPSIHRARRSCTRSKVCARNSSTPKPDETRLSNGIWMPSSIRFSRKRNFRNGSST